MKSYLVKIMLHSGSWGRKQFWWGYSGSSCWLSSGLLVLLLCQESWWGLPRSILLQPLLQVRWC